MLCVLVCPLGHQQDRIDGAAALSVVGLSFREPELSREASTKSGFA